MLRRTAQRRLQRRMISLTLLTYMLWWGLILVKRVRSYQKPIQEDVVEYVDPRIGTGGDGHTFPGPCAPFGKVQPSPDNGDGGWNWTSGYHISSNSVFGFSNTHLSGTGIPDLMDVAMMPFCLNREEMGSRGFEEYLRNLLIVPPTYTDTGMEDLYVGKFNTKALYNLLVSNISHEEETARAGYYSVVLKKHNISVELTAGSDVGMHRYTLLEDATSCDEHIVAIDVSRSHFSLGTSVYGGIEIISSDGNPYAVEGHRATDAWATDRIMYYRIEFSEPIRDSFVLNNSNDTLGWDGCSLSGCHIAFLKFDAFDGLLARISVSSVGTKGAKASLNASNVSFGFNFEKLQASTESLWREQLSKIRVFGHDVAAKRTFYTAMYHAMVAPVVHSDLDGSFRGPDDAIHTTRNYIYYSTLSIWDAFRSHYALLTLTNRKISHDIAMTMLHHASLSNKRLPVWTLGGKETDTMIGYHAVSYLAEALKKGILGSTLKKAALKYAHATAQKKSYIIAEKHIDQYGFVPSDMIPESTSMTLEYAFDDWCIAEIARACGDNKLESYYRNRSTFYTNVFDPTSRFMRPRQKDGSFVKDFDPSYSEHETGAFTEGTAWQYLWFVPHDVVGLIDLLGGKDAAEETLDELFFPTSTDTDIHGNQSSIDITGLIGRYAHGNEPGHHSAYIYNIVGSPRKTQYLTRRILRTMYSDRPDGITGNDDCGQMSAWYILSSIGIYPLNPADATYQITSPLYERVEMTLPSSNEEEENSLFVIDAPGATMEEYMYIDQAILYNHDGSRVRTLFSQGAGALVIHHDEIMSAGRLYLKMVSMEDNPFASRLSQTNTPH